MSRRDFKFCPLCGKRFTTRKIEGRKRQVCPICEWINYENPLPSAAAFIINSEGEILLVERGIEPGKGKWALPSGFIEIDETPEKACLRELKEETGLEGKIIRLIGCYSQKSLMYKNVLIVGYLVDVKGTPCPGSDSLSTEYFSPSRLPQIAFPSHCQIIKDGLKVTG